MQLYLWKFEVSLMYFLIEISNSCEGKKKGTIWSGGGVCLPCQTGVNQKLVTLGFSNASHLTSLHICFCFIFLFVGE